MLEGLEVTVLPFSSIDLGDRADPEFYSKENLAIQKALKDHHSKSLGLFCKLAASAFYPAATHLYEHGDVPFVRCVDSINYPLISKLQDEEFERIPRSFVEGNKGMQFIHKGEIVVTKVGTPCYASVVHEHDELALSRTVLGLVNIKKISPYYLMAFLRSKYGFNQLMRQRELTIQYQLTLERVREVQIYEGSPKLQAAVEKTVLDYFRELQDAHNKYTDVEQTLLRSLGLENWQPPEPLSYERKASEVFTAGRLDAEHFQPKYKGLYDHLARSFPLNTLAELGKVTKGVTAPYSEDGSIPIIRSGDLTDIGDEKKFLRALPDPSIFTLQRGDVLVSSIGFGSIGKVQVFDKEGDYGTVSEVTVIRQKRINPYYLHFFLRSLAGQMQIERYITGATGQLHLYPKDVGRIFIPLIPVQEQNRFEEIAKSAEIARQQARTLLDRAKRAVEIAIEESEEKAMRFLEGVN